jgi:thiosulfate/3-mercaptopyruvate sulfurtransferase
MVTSLTSRFTGEAPEPRPGMPSGHIPNSLPLPFSSYLEPHNDKQPYSTYKSIPELKSTLAQAVGGESKLTELEDKPIVFTCGSGMTAAVGWLADTVVRESEGKEPRGVLYDEVSSLRGRM